MRCALVATAALLLTGRAVAEEGAPPNAPNKEGDYGGVVPGEKPEGGKKKAKRPARGTLTWIGFEPKDGGAQLFFQSVAGFEVDQHMEGATLVVHLSLTRLAANTWRQIDTRFFDNPLGGVVARAVRASRATKNRPARKTGIEVRITFKNPKDAREGSLKTATEADGMFYAYLSFPEGADAGQPTIDEPEK